jgi:hypothetical protein
VEAHIVWYEIGLLIVRDVASRQAPSSDVALLASLPNNPIQSKTDVDGLDCHRLNIDAKPLPLLTPWRTVHLAFSQLLTSERAPLGIEER